MIWLQSSPWARWVLTALIATLAVWTEFRPAPMVDHPFATEDIPAGAPITDQNTELKPVPKGLFGSVPRSGYAIREILDGQPLTSRILDDEPVTPASGWWSLELPLPRGTAVGSEVRLVLTTSGRVIPGVVTTAPDVDSFGSGTGTAAFAPEFSADVGLAVNAGQFVVLISNP